MAILNKFPNRKCVGINYGGKNGNIERFSAQQHNLTRDKDFARYDAANPTEGFRPGNTRKEGKTGETEIPQHRRSVGSVMHIYHDKLIGGQILMGFGTVEPKSG